MDLAPRRPEHDSGLPSGRDGSDTRRAWWASSVLAPGVALGSAFACPLFNHDGLARLEVRSAGAEWGLVCGCAGDDVWRSLANVLAGLRHGEAEARKRGARAYVRSPPELRAWHALIDHEAGVNRLRPRPVHDDATTTEDERRVLHGLALLEAVRRPLALHAALNGALPYSARFAGAWTGVSRRRAHVALLGLQAAGLIERAGTVDVKNNRAEVFTYRIAERASAGPQHRVGRAGSPSSHDGTRMRPATAPIGTLVPDALPRPASLPRPRAWVPPAGFAPVVALALEGPSCALDAHRAAWSWRSQGGRCWTCSICFGPPADLGAVDWGRAAREVAPQAAQEPMVAAESRHRAMARRAAQLWRPVAVSSSTRDELARRLAGWLATNAATWTDVAARVGHAAERAERDEHDLLALFAPAGASA